MKIFEFSKKQKFEYKVTMVSVSLSLSHTHTQNLKKFKKPQKLAKTSILPILH